jgi:hypothetical protein
MVGIHGSLTEVGAQRALQARALSGAVRGDASRYLEVILRDLPAKSHEVAALTIRCAVTGGPTPERQRRVWAGRLAHVLSGSVDLGPFTIGAAGAPINIFDDAQGR